MNFGAKKRRKLRKCRVDEIIICYILSDGHDAMLKCVVRRNVMSYRLLFWVMRQGQ